ncbi:hypothetical protein VTN02DRAFT_1005 [Thermoascus thermophilus]
MRADSEKIDGGKTRKNVGTTPPRDLLSPRAKFYLWRLPSPTILEPEEGLDRRHAEATTLTAVLCTATRLPERSLKKGEVDRWIENPEVTYFILDGGLSD